MAMGIMQAAGSMMQISAQNKAASQQQAAAIKRQEAQYKQSEYEQKDIREQYSEQLSNLERQSLQQVSTIESYQADTGLTGQSQLREQANVFMQEAFEQGSLVSKEKSELAQKGMKNIQTGLQTQSTINQLESQKTSGLSAMLQIAGSGLSGYSTGQNIKF